MFKNKNLIFLPWAIFAVSITILGVFAYTKKFDLEMDDYYAAELQHSATMDKRQRGQAFASQIKPYVEQGVFKVKYPANFLNNPQFEGELRFHRASDRSLDTVFAIIPNAELIQSYQSPKLIPGYWKLEWSWKLGSMEYLLNDTIMLP